MDGLAMYKKTICKLDSNILATPKCCKLLG